MTDIDPLELRMALGAFMTGVTVVTTRGRDGIRLGFTANSFTSVSLEPPLVLFCIAKTSANCAAFLESGHFAVNVLAEEQRAVSRSFASRVPDRFAAGDWRAGATGSPLLVGAAAWFDCRLHDSVDAGDHVVLIGRVVAFDHGAANPLGYCRGSYVTSILEQQALEAVPRTTHVGAILEHQGRVLLLEDEKTGLLGLPEGDCIGGDEAPGSLQAVLARLGISAEIGFVFAVFEEDKGTPTEGISVYYRGAITQELPAALEDRLYAYKDIPWPRLPSGDIRIMLQRYVDESLQGRYGLYLGDRGGGKVHPLP